MSYQKSGQSYDGCVRKSTLVNCELRTILQKIEYSGIMI